MTGLANTITCLSLLFLICSTGRGEDQVGKENLKWVQGYLINTVFTLEYEAIMDANKTDGHCDPAFAVQESATQLWARAKLSLLEAKKGERQLPNFAHVNGLLTEQEDLLKKSKVPDFMTAAGNATINEAFLRKKVSGGLDERFRNAWADLTSPTNFSKPRCSLDAAEVQMFSKHQRSLTASNVTADAQELIAPMKNWDISKVECLVFALMAAPPEAHHLAESAPLALLQAIQQVALKQANDEVLQVASVILLLEKNQYPESLRILMDLQDSNPSYRLAVDTVQRIFSIRQQGDGKVAIRGI